MIIKVAIIEDEQAFIDKLKGQLNEWAEKHEHLLDLKSYTSGDSFLIDWERNYFDLLCFDVMLPNSDDGSTLAKYVRSQNDETPILFITSVRNNFNDGFRVSAIQYLVKPVSFNEIEECMDMVVKNKRSRKKSVYCFHKNKHTIARIPYHDILYFSGALQYVEIHSTLGVERQLERLKNIEPTLPDEFVRCHRSIIVNIESVFSLSSSSLTLIDHSDIPISKSFFQNVNDKFVQYFK